MGSWMGRVRGSVDGCAHRCYVAPVDDASTMMPVIRTATEADLPALRRVYRAASLGNPADAPLLRGHPEYLVFAGDEIAVGGTRVAVGRVAGVEDIRGFATVVEASGGGLELDDLFVDPVWQRRGIARMLIADAVQRALAAGDVRLYVTANPHASAFYSSVGFVEGGRVATPLGEGARMSLDVRSFAP